MASFIFSRRLWGFLGIIWVAIWILPFINGLIEGHFLLKLLWQQMKLDNHNLRSSIRTSQILSRASIPGYKSAHDAGFPPYYVPQIRDPTDWWERLGLTRFDVNETRIASTPYSKLVNELASLELYREERRHENSAPWHHWVFVSAHADRAEGVFYDKWDEAFDDLLRHHYAKPTPGNASFHFVSCPYRYFCGAWFVKAPALLHFTTEAPDLFGGKTTAISTSHKAVPGYSNVTVRAVEFPITDPRHLGLAPGVFPSPFNQLRAVTTDQYGWQRLPSYGRIRQVWRRLREHAEAAEQAHPRTYGRLLKLEKGLLFNKLGFEKSLHGQEVPRIIGTGISVAFQVLCAKALLVALDYILKACKYDTAMSTGTADGIAGSLQPEEAIDEIMVLDFIEVFPDTALEIARSSTTSGEVLEKLRDAIRSLLSPEEVEVQGPVPVLSLSLSGYRLLNTSQG